MHQIVRVLHVLFIIGEVVLLFNLLIIVHELGHFLAAKWRGLVIEKFGIWFGRPLWKKNIGGIEYSLGSIPAGGFVALPQLAPMDVIEGKVDVDRAQLPTISALDKIIVAFAGPLFSLLLALFFAAIVWLVGHPVSESDTTTVIGYVLPGSPAEKAGLQPGDKILAVDGQRVTRFSGMTDSVIWNVLRSEGDTIPFTFERAGAVQTVAVEPFKAETRGWRRKSVRQVLILPAQTAIIDRVQPGTPAAVAGLQPHDVVLGFNGHPIYNAYAVIDYIEKHGEQPITLQLRRGRENLAATVQPKILQDEKTPRIGIQFSNTGRMSVAHPDPLEQVYTSITGTLNTIGAVASPKSDVKLQHLSGPAGIWLIYYRLFGSDQGWRLALWFSVILNVNLALLNLLPLPVLDGGHIVLAVIEAVRRRPVNIRVLEVIQTGCAVLIIGYMLYVTFYDAQDLPFIREKLEKLDPPTAKARP